MTMGGGGFFFCDNFAHFSPGKLNPQPGGKISEASQKKQVIAIGKKTGCAVELHPIEIIYNAPSTLLFCRYVNALRTLPDPLDACI